MGDDEFEVESIERDDDGVAIAWLPGVPVMGRGANEDEAVADLCVRLDDYWPPLATVH